jgi:hypothetical protein
MHPYRAFMVAAQAILVTGLVVTYVSPLVGLLGFVDAQHVTFAMLSGLAVAFVAAVGYFAASGQRLSQAPQDRFNK